VLVVLWVVRVPVSRCGWCGLVTLVHALWLGVVSGVVSEVIGESMSTFTLLTHLLYALQVVGFYWFYHVVHSYCSGFPGGICTCGFRLSCPGFNRGKIVPVGGRGSRSPLLYIYPVGPSGPFPLVTDYECSFFATFCYTLCIHMTDTAVICPFLHFVPVFCRALPYIYVLSNMVIP